MFLYFLKASGDPLPCSFRSLAEFQFFIVAGLSSPLPCWLSAQGHSQLLEATHIPWLVAPFIFRASNGDEPFLCFKSLSFSYLTRWERVSAFEDLFDYTRPTQMISTSPFQGPYSPYIICFWRIRVSASLREGGFILPTMLPFSVPPSPWLSIWPMKILNPNPGQWLDIGGQEKFEDHRYCNRVMGQS